MAKWAFLFCFFSLSHSIATSVSESERIYWEAEKIYQKTLQKIEELKDRKERRRREGRADVLPSLCNGRLTLQSATPVPNSDQTSKATVYFTPYNGNKITLYSGTVWQMFPFTEISISVAGISADTNYDIFAYNNAGTVALELSAAWSDNTTRSDTLTTVNGVYVKSGVTTRRYLGTIRGSGSGVTEDSVAHRFVWNNYNRVTRNLLVKDTTNSWTYNSTTWRSANNSNTNRVDFVLGFPEVLVRASVMVNPMVSTNINPGVGGVGLDTTSANNATIFGGATQVSPDVNQFWAEYKGYPSLGYHYLQWVESASTNTATFFGDNNLTYWQSGLVATVDG